MGHSDFAAVFRPGARFEDRSVIYEIEVEPTGELVTEGRVVLFDPVPDELGGFGRIPYVRTVPAGTYPIETAFARNLLDPSPASRDPHGIHPEHRTIAAIRVRLKPTSARRWEIATLDDVQPDLPWGEDPGVRALAGTLALAAAPHPFFACEPLDDGWAEMTTDTGDGVILFDVGEGSYPAYWGLDDADELCELCIDTSLMTRAVWRDVSFSLPLREHELAAANEIFAEPARVRAVVEAPLVLRIEGDVRRFWYGRIVDRAGKEIGGSFAPKAQGSGHELIQRYDCTELIRYGAVALRVRMVLPNEPLEPMSG